MTEKRSSFCCYISKLTFWASYTEFFTQSFMFWFQTTLHRSLTSCCNKVSGNSSLDRELHQELLKMPDIMSTLPDCVIETVLLSRLTAMELAQLSTVCTRFAKLVVRNGNNPNACPNRSDPSILAPPRVYTNKLNSQSVIPILLRALGRSHCHILPHIGSLRHLADNACFRRMSMRCGVLSTLSDGVARRR